MPGVTVHFYMQQQQSNKNHSNQTSNFRWCCDELPVFYAVYIKNSHERVGGWVKHIDAGNLMKFPMPFKFDPCVGVRAGMLHVLHLLMPAHKVTFISTAKFSEVPYPLCFPFVFKPFFLCHVKNILFLVNYLSLSTSSIPLCGLTASPWCR